MNSTARRLIVYELNEVPFKIVDLFARMHPQHAFSRALGRAAQFIASTPDRGHLHPTTTWPTFHRGVPDSIHGITEFGFDAREVNAKYPQIWNLLARSGVSIGVGGSLGSYPVPADLTNIKYYLPDTFAPAAEAYPESLSLFQAFNLSMVRQNGRNVGRQIDLAAGLQLMLRAPMLGITPTTVAKIAGQLLDERRVPARVVRRRTLQAVVAFDVLYKQFAAARPQYATFFSNHVASAQHRYWAATFPDEFTRVQYPAEWRETYKGEIEHAMCEAAFQIAKLIRFTQANPEHLLMVVSSMGQEANEAERIERQLMLNDPGRLFAHLGIPSSDWKRLPGMEPVYIFTVEPSSRDRFRTAMESFTVNGRHVTARELQPGRFEVVLGHPNLVTASLALSLEGRPVGMDDLGIANVDIQDAAGSTGWHVPDGILIVFDPSRDLSAFASRDRVKTTEVTAAIVRNFGLPLPSYMAEPSSRLEAAMSGSWPTTLRVSNRPGVAAAPPEVIAVPKSRGAERRLSQ
jgi:hypothetical protein